MATDRESREAEGYIHPSVEPKFFNGSIVKYNGEVYRVDSRSITWDGVITYAIVPVTAEPVEFFDAYGKPYTAIPFTSQREGESIPEAPEDALMAVMPEYESRLVGQPSSVLQMRVLDGARIDIIEGG